MSQPREEPGAGEPSFEAAMARLEAIVEAMQSGRIGVEESLARYEEAMRLANRCRAILDAAELKIQQIQFEAGAAPRLGPFDPPPPSTPDNDE